MFPGGRFPPEAPVVVVVSAVWVYPPFKSVGTFSLLYFLNLSTLYFAVLVIFGSFLNQDTL